MEGPILTWRAPEVTGLARPQLSLLGMRPVRAPYNHCLTYMFDARERFLSPIFSMLVLPSTTRAILHLPVATV